MRVNIWHDKCASLVAIWRKPTTRDYSFIEKLGCTISTVSCLPSLANVKNLIPGKNDNRQLFMDLYVLAWAAVLVGLLFAQSSHPRFVFAIATYRVFDIVSYRAYFLLEKSRKQPWTPKELRRSLLVAFVNLFELIVAFAVLYYVSQSVHQGGDLQLHLSPRQALYFSLVTTTTVGYGDFIPVGSGRRLAAVQLTTIILFLMLLLPALVSVFSPELSKTEKRLSDSENQGDGEARTED